MQEATIELGFEFSWSFLSKQAYLWAEGGYADAIGRVKTTQAVY